ncbi:MAG TPA: hypothetical protein ENF34_03290 [Candidatus Bathyarchaeota archaeon]|nr:hypothetical protein [Candidatus Bathyarchaeota archaeon]
MRERVELVFTRIDNPEREVKLLAHLDDEMVRYAMMAAKRLGFEADEELSLHTPACLPVRVIGKSVREIVNTYGTRFVLVGADCAEARPMGEQVELVFTRIDNPERKVKLLAYLDDEMAYYAMVAAKKLGLRTDEEFGLQTPSGLPIPKIADKSVREIVNTYGTMFNLVSADTPA